MLSRLLSLVALLAISASVHSAEVHRYEATPGSKVSVSGTGAVDQAWLPFPNHFIHALEIGPNGKKVVAVAPPRGHRRLCHAPDAPVGHRPRCAQVRSVSVFPSTLIT